MELPNKKELAKLIDLVTDDLNNILETESLAKANPGTETSGEKVPEGSSVDVPEESASSSESSGKEPAGPPDGAPAPDGAAPDEQGEQAPSDDQTDPAADASGTVEALASEYSKLPLEELKMHFVACEEALMQALGGDGEGNEAPPEQAPQDQAPAPAPEVAPTGDASAAPMAPGMGKSEFDSPETKGGAEKAEVAKSEPDFATLFAEIETLKKGLKDKEEHIQKMETSFGEAAVGLKKLIERGSGMRKSIASTAFTPKPGSEAANPDKIDVSQLSRTEVLSRLKDVTAPTNTSLTKSDRATINEYVFGNCSAQKVEKFLIK